MARRASSSLHPVWIMATLFLVVVAVVGGKYLFTRVEDPYRTIPPMEVQAYLENSNSLRGNVYKLTGRVLNSLAWSPTAGRLFSLEVDAGGATEILPVLVPREFNQINIQKGQEFILQISVGDKGILTAQDIRKT